MKLHKLYVAFAYLICFCTAGAMEEKADILRAAGNGKAKRVKLLLTKDPNLVNAQNEWKWTPLHRASRWGHTETAALLLQYNADVNAKDDDKLTPLHMAAWEGHTETAALLLQHKADVNAQNEWKWTPTPLHMASYWDHPEMVQLLLSYGAIPYSPINLFEKFSRFSKLYAQGHQTFINKVRKERDEVFWILYSIERKEGNKGVRVPRELCYKIASLAFSGIQEWHQFKKAHPEIAALANTQEEGLS